MYDLYDLYEHYSLERVLKSSPFKLSFYFYSHNQQGKFKYIRLALYTFHIYVTQRIRVYF